MGMLESGPELLDKLSVRMSDIRIHPQERSGPLSCLPSEKGDGKWNPGLVTGVS